MKSKDQVRRRRGVKPVKTGCITCKIRRIKCDEEKPSCKKCTSTGRKCDGYEPVQKPAEQETSMIRRPSTTAVADPKEGMLYQYFVTVTAPTLAGNFLSEFWLRHVLQAGQYEPSVRHAMIAVGALHQEFRFRHLSNLSIDELRTFAFRQHAIAINRLHRSINSQTQPIPIALISCILFICYNSLLGDRAMSLLHLRAGLKILEDARKQDYSIASPYEQDFGALLLGIGVQVTMFVNPVRKKERLVLWDALRKAGVLIISNFQSLDDAYHALNKISAEILHSRVGTVDRIPGLGMPNPNGQEGRRAANLLRTWLQSFDAYLGNATEMGQMDNKRKRAASLLKIHWLLMSIAASSPDPAPDKFAELIFLSEAFLNNDNNAALQDNVTFSANLGIIAPLLYTTLRAPDVARRWQAYDLLSRASGREGMWDAVEALKVAENMLHVEKRPEKNEILIPAYDRDEDKIWREASAKSSTPFCEIPTIPDSGLFGRPFTRSIEVLDA